MDPLSAQRFYDLFHRRQESQKSVDTVEKPGFKRVAAVDNPVPRVVTAEALLLESGSLPEPFRRH